MSDIEVDAKPKVVTLQPGGLNYREWEFRLKNVLGYHGLARICFKAKGQDEVKKPRPGLAGKSQDDWDESKHNAQENGWKDTLHHINSSVGQFANP